MKTKTLRTYVLLTCLLAMFIGTSQAQTNCSKPAPPNTSDVRPATIDWVWTNRLRAPLFGFYNLMLDQIFDNQGYLNYIVRWESNETVTAAQRDAIETMLNRQVNKWVGDWLNGYDCWPYGSIQVKVVAWAVANRSVLLWNDNEWSGKVYVGYTEEGAPHGPKDCNRFYHQDGNYPSCTAQHFDMALWCTQGFGGGAGGDWGQRVSSSYILQNINSESVHILLHEMGHSNGLPDFYTAEEFPPASTGGLPPCVMQAGAASYVTPWDGWMFRRVYSELKARGDRGWVFNNVCTPTSITPYAQINGGAWSQTASATVNAGSSVKFGPQPVSGGSWSWSGPAGFSASTREITISNIQSSQAGTYVATYTNDCGAKSTQNFTVTVSGSGGVTNIALIATASTSYVSSWETLSAVNDNSNPSNSNDKSSGAYGNWNHPNTLDWVQYNWSSGYTISKTEVYWFDDNGGVLTPTTAYVEYWNGSSWVNCGTVPKVKNAWNVLNINNVTSTRFRISMLNTSQSTGILEWRVWGTPAAAASSSSVATSIAKTDDAIGITVYPNPASTSFRVDLKGFMADEDVTLVICDMQGKELFRSLMEKDRSADINTGMLKLSGGSYLIKAVSADKALTRKLMITE